MAVNNFDEDEDNDDDVEKRIMMIMMMKMMMGWFTQVGQQQESTRMINGKQQPILCVFSYI